MASCPGLFQTVQEYQGVVAVLEEHLAGQADGGTMAASYATYNFCHAQEQPMG